MTVTTIHSSATLRDAIMVFKPRISLSIMLSAVGGIAVSQGPQLAFDQFVFISLAVFLAAGSAGAFNQWFERDLDALMARTANRPFVTGQFTANLGWLTLILCTLAGSVVMAGIATNWWAALYTFLGAFTYGVVYTVWLKQRSWINIIVGGLAGSFAVLAGAAAVNPIIGIEALLLTVVLFLWTPPHFWSLAMFSSEDYQRAGVPMLPVIIGHQACAWIILAHTIALSLIALIPAWYGMGTFYFLGALIGGAYFTWTSIALVINPIRSRAVKNFLASLLQLCLLLGGAVADWAFGRLL